MESPYSCRERPVAKSQMSIISCTSPSPSVRILPISSVTRWPSSDLCPAQPLADLAHDLPALGGRYRAPLEEGLVGARDDAVVFVHGDLAHRGDARAVDGRMDLEFGPGAHPLAGEAARIHIFEPERRQQLCAVRDEVAAPGAGVVMVAGFIAVLSSLSQFADLAQRRLHLELDAHSAVFCGGFRRVA